MKKLVVRKDNGVVLGVCIGRKERRKLARKEKLVGQVVSIGMEHFDLFTHHTTMVLKLGEAKPATA